MLAKAIKVDDYENMSKQQLKNISIMPSAPKPPPRSAPSPKKCTTTPAPRPGKRAPNNAQDLKNTHLHLTHEPKHLHPLTNPPTAN